MVLFLVKMPQFGGFFFAFSVVFLSCIALSCSPFELPVRGVLSLPTSAFRADEIVNV